MTFNEKRMKTLCFGLSSSIAKLRGEISPKTVHHLRTTIRRFESVVRHARPSLNKKQEHALEDLGELRKRAGKVRNLDVQMGLLSVIGNGSTATDRHALEECFKTKRERQAGRLACAGRELERSKFLAHMERIAEKALAAPGMQANAGAPLQEARSQLAQLAAEFHLETEIKPRRLHQLRIKLKMVRYLAEIGAESEEQRQFLREMKAVQDAIGEWHDWECLAESAEKHFRQRVNCPLLLEIRALFAARYTAATAAVARLFAQVKSVPGKKQPGAAHPARQLTRPA